MELFTIGVYGSTEEEFFDKLVENKIDTFCDIRQRRGVRGSKYKFVNSRYLQSKLNDLDIAYIYEKQLAPTKQIREMQWEEDKAEHNTKKTRKVLGHAFCCGYERIILDAVDMDGIIDSFKRMGAHNVVFFCLEQKPEACHRFLVTKRIGNRYNLKVKHL